MVVIRIILLKKSQWMVPEIYVVVIVAREDLDPPRDTQSRGGLI